MPSPGQISGLLVEDVKAMRIYLRTVLESEEVRLTDVGGLAEARTFLRALADSPPDFIVLDLELPDGNGLDLMPDVPAKTRVLALTADVTREVELQCRDAGCDLVIEKSGELASLRDKISDAVTLRKREDIRDRALCYSYVPFLAEVLTELHSAQAQEDVLKIRQIAHRLRGTAVHFGYPGIGSAARSVNLALQGGQLDQFRAAAGTLCARISDALEAHHLKTRRQSITEVHPCAS
jgi:CheY-like chemotaxis protein